jgi:hypothetical protein
MEKINKRKSMSHRGLIITLIVVGLVIMCCLLLWVLWDRIKIEDTDSETEPVDPEMIGIDISGTGNGTGNGGYDSGGGNKIGGSHGGYGPGNSHQRSRFNAEYETSGLNNMETAENMLIENMNNQFLNI